MHGEFPMDPMMLGLVADGEIIVRDDEIDAFEDADGNRVLTSTDRDEGVMVVEGMLPICPGCSDDAHVYCIECGEPYLACSCVDEVEDFFCLACSSDFVWTYTEAELDEMLNDIDGSWQEAHIVTTSEDDEELSCSCTPERQYICAPCGVTRDSLDDPWRAMGVKGDPSMLKKSEKPACKCEPEASFFCSVCKVRRNTPDAEWDWLAEHQEKQLEEARSKSAAKKQADKKATKICTCTPKPQYWCDKCKVNNNSKPPTTYSSGSYGYSYSKCRHYAETLVLPDGTPVNASSMNNTRGEKDPAPDFGLYLDWGWHPYWRNEHIAWPDYGVPTDFFYAAIQIEAAYERAKAGEVVEVGCIGGHGRTGTALACMVLLADDDITPKEAMAYVRNNYCKETIESDKQEWWIEWFRAYIDGDELPEQPVFKAKSYTTTTSTYKKDVTPSVPEGGPHGVQAHYELWTAGKECSEKSCKWWEGDVGRFAKGDVPKSVTVTDGKTSGTDWNKWKIIDGFRIPKPGVGETQHSSTARQGCKCDYCRYTERHGAFLEKSEGPDTVLSAMPDGTIMEISVVKDFKQGPPSAEALTVGTRAGEYIWTAEGWVWEKLVADKDIDIIAIAEARHNNPDLGEAANEAAQQAQRLADALKVFNGDDDDDEPEPPRVGAISYDHDSLDMRPIHAQHEDGQVGHTACGLMMDGDKTPFSVTNMLASAFVQDFFKPCGTCKKIIERKLEDWQEEIDREQEILSPVQQLRAMAAEDVAVLFDENAEDDPTICPDIDTFSSQPEKDLTTVQLELMQLGLARLNYGSDDPSLTRLEEVRYVLWDDDDDVWTWDEVMGAATINPDEADESSYPPKPDIDSKEQEPESIVPIETLRLVTLGLNKLLGAHPSTLEIREALRDFDEDSWNALMQLAFREASGDDNFCLDCGTWADHSTTQHTGFVNDPEPHEQEDLALLAEEADDVERVTWGKKLHQIVKGGPKRGKVGV